MIKFSHVSFSYPNQERKVLNNINLELPPGSLTLVTGASGSGKSTLLKCINGLAPHFTGGSVSGEVNIYGHDPIIEGPKGLSKIVSYVFQEPESQFVFDIVEDEIAFSLENFGISREEMVNRINLVLNQLDLNFIKDAKVSSLSGGEKQKVAIASALVNDPRVLILDEPTSQLDPFTADALLKFIITLKTTMDLTILVSEHRLERLLPYADSIIHLGSQGAIKFGSTQSILHEMEQVPPIIEIARKFNLQPYPLSSGTFPEKIRMSLSDKESSSVLDQESADQTPVLECRNLSTAIKGEQILKNVNLNLNKGQIAVIHGPNGSGKTTLCRSLVGLQPSEGQFWLNGQKIKSLVTENLIKEIGYLPQNPNDLLFAETVLDELIITLNNHHLPYQNEYLREFLAHFDLDGKQGAYPRDLSVGERQRTALAAITVQQPNIIILDEPTRGMDYQNKTALCKILSIWRDQGRSICLVTHDVEFGAILADRVIFLEDGEITFDGHPKVAYTKFPRYRTQTASIFPNNNWITPEDIQENS